jgi:hypothetical protein
MKAMKLTLAALFVITAVFFLACDNPLALGDKLDLEGPVVTIASPEPRSIGKEFILEGQVTDKSAVDRMLITARLGDVQFDKRWRYTRNSGWQVSENNGATWKALDLPGTEWKGRNASAAEWTVPIFMDINGTNSTTPEGQYMFTVQAWDEGDMSDDNSLRTRALIFDRDPPKVEVYNPILYSKYEYEYNSVTGEFDTDLSDNELQDLRDELDWKKPELLGKFLTSEFQMQWQIKDNNEVRSIELRFYEHNVNIDGLPETDVPGYFYSYEKPLDPYDFNGSVWVPDLNGDVKKYSGKYDGGEIKIKVTAKTTIQVVALCKDAAKLVNQEKVLGYFIYWPQAVSPWITYTDGMEIPGYYKDASGELTEYANVGDYNTHADLDFTFYPGRSIKATAFQTQGVSKVEYTLHSYDFADDGKTPSYSNPISLAYMRQLYPDTDYAENSDDTIVIRKNTKRPNGSYSAIFQWDFLPPPRPTDYVIRAQAFDSGDNPVGGDFYVAVFRVQNITFPDFPISPQPSAGKPLYQSIGRPEADAPPTGYYPLPPENMGDAAHSNSIRISGIADDAVEVSSVYMVWINPESTGYAGMSQLQYFRDSNYVGWTNAIAHTGAWPMLESKYDPAHPNKVWKLTVTNLNRTNADGRVEYRYHQVIPLSELNIGGTNPLKSQVFLLRAEGPNDSQPGKGKCKIITYAPQGDGVGPIIKISNVQVGSETFNSGDGSVQIPKFAGGEVLKVNGTWTEDSTEFLDSEKYFYHNMRFTINGINIRRNAAGTAWVRWVDDDTEDGAESTLSSDVSVSFTPNNPSTSATSGTFTVTATVGADSSNNTLKITNLKDTLVVNAKGEDIGGNPSEDGASWLIQSDTLRFLRISSLAEDTAYRQNGVIRIFIEFNKPVLLRKGTANWPVLRLNTTGGAQAVALYDQSQESENTRHYFTYTVAANQNTLTTGPDLERFLNVNGISIDNGATALTTASTAWEQTDYSFTFVNTGINGIDKEELRLTANTTHTDAFSRDPITGMSTDHNKVFARSVPVNVNSTTEGQYTLGRGKRITVDNAPPTITGFTASPTGWHGAGAEIYITATFSEPVKVPAGVPRLTLTNGYQTSDQAADVRVNNNMITFKYTVGNNHNTGTAALQVTGLTDIGNILDIPGNPMTATPSGTLTGVYIDTTAPGAPTVTVHSGTPPNNSITLPMATLYHDTVYIRVAGITGAQHFGRVEYSLNGGQDWTSSANLNTDVQLVNTGSYTIQARQTDQAGNVSNPSAAITFTRDPGTLITRISSSAANGTYTHNSAAIPITVYFRKPLNIATGTTPQITLNARTTNGTGAVITVNTLNVALPQNNVNSLTFNYTVANGHGTPVTNPITYLDVTGITGITATDTNNVSVTSFLALPAEGSNALLKENKQITVLTGNLSRSSLSFTDEAGDGIQADDGSYWTTLQIVFNRNVSKGNGNITIEQIPGTGNTTYRLPAVLTETQYNRFRSVANFDSYYTKGTNGYKDGEGSDTTVKYVLNYSNDPSTAPTGDLATFATAFRQAEGISLSVNSAAVSISGNTLKVKLSGSSAPQVPGATYNVSYPAGFVIDELGNSIAVANNVTATLGGVARPFVRIRKTQDTITVNANPSMTQPRLVATQPYQTYARIDSRTPGSSIVYRANGVATSVTDTNWHVTGTAVTPSPPATRPSAPSGGTTYNGVITVGNALTGETYEGYMWWIRAQASVGGTTSLEAEEVAYRTAITYRLRNGTAAITANAAESIMASGDQIWIRGGDAIGSSSIPGFPLTWEDSWSSLANKRAGIRLMTKVTNTTSTGGNNANEVNNSTWKFVTWEINATAYVDFIRGNDTESNANIAWQYGPKSSFYQRAGWTSYKDRYPVYPGKHRWCDAGLLEGDASGKGQINFSGTPLVRDTYANNNPNPFPGVNTATAGN